jgi:hypothetical protein
MGKFYDPEGSDWGETKTWTYKENKDAFLTLLGTPK